MELLQRAVKRLVLDNIITFDSTIILVIYTGLGEALM